MSITVTAAQGGSVANGMALRVFVLTQAAAVQNGATQTAAGSRRCVPLNSLMLSTTRRGTTLILPPIRSRQ